MKGFWYTPKGRITAFDADIDKRLVQTPLVQSDTSLLSCYTLKAS